MTHYFEAAQSRCPLPYDPAAGLEALEAFRPQPRSLCDLIVGAAGCSSYLRGLMARETIWLTQAFLQAPDTVVTGIIEEMTRAAPAQLGSALRQAKRRVALYAGLADLGGVWTLEQVTGALTDFADAAVDLALKTVLAPELARGKLPGQTLEDLPAAAGMVVIAMGKMGAHELNYSSDIDLICLFDDSRYAPEDVMTARAVFIKVTRKMTALLNDITGEGYVFRTDLRLRPDASVTPVCMAMEAAERYYESVGRTWERAAHIKARPCAGDIAAGGAYLKRLRPFIWRKHLDFAAIEDAHQIRVRLREHKRLHGQDGLEGRDIKLAPGGIREIEFFTQTHQIIAGGRDPDLRKRGTVEGLAMLAQKGWISADIAERLTMCYRAHRDVEHRLQMVADAHTHALPQSPEDFDRIARMMGQRDTSLWRADLSARLRTVRDVTEGFYLPRARAEQDSDIEAPAITARWRQYPALRSERAVKIFERLKPELLMRLNGAARPEEAFAAFDGFLAGLPAGVQLFSMFEANPKLLTLIVDIAASAPALAQYLSRNAGVLDAVIGGGFFAPWPGLDGLKDALRTQLEQMTDYEAQLDAARRWTKEWHFRIGVHHLRRLTDADEAGGQYAELAEAVVATLFPVVVAQVAQKHGPPPGRGAMVMAMGSLGAGWLTAHSDLDLIVIYDACGQENSQGRRPLAARAYFARMTQALITALSAPMAEGKLYEVDMRLRPSGRQGPVATSLASFERYQREDAWTWEHLAMTRARPIAGQADLCAEVERVRCDVIANGPLRENALADVADMRARLAATAAAPDPLEPKPGPGRMKDIELFAQSCALLHARTDRSTYAHLRACVDLGESVEVLAAQYTLLRKLQCLGRLTVEGPLRQETIGTGAGKLLAQATGAQDIDTLAATIAENAALCDGLISAALAMVPPKDQINGNEKGDPA
jgi:glutamate-ammonia-ligase adenylyltransferase